MFAVDSLNAAEELLASIYQTRIASGDLLNAGNLIRGPVGLFLVRDDGANGSKLAKEVSKSFGFWDAKTAHYFDGVFLGWGYDGEPRYVEDFYLTCISDLESKTSWRENGESYLIIVDYELDLTKGTGSFDFSSAIPLPITKLLIRNDWTQLSSLILDGLLAPVEGNEGGGTWQISDYLAILRLRERFWQDLVKRLGVLLGAVDGVKDYRVRDLRKK